MAEEELKSCSYHSFADRYQADLELIYQKYERLDDGCIESQEFFLSNLGCEENGELDWLQDFFDDNIDPEDQGAAFGSDGSSDDGWESDSSGHTSTRELSSQDEASSHSPAKKKLGKEELDEQNGEIIKTNKPIQLNRPLSSTLASNPAAMSEIKMDPKLNIAEFQTNNVFKDLKILENNYMLDQGNSNSFMPGVHSGNILTSTKLEASSPDLPRNKVPHFRNEALQTRAITSRKVEERGLPDQIEGNPSPEGISSFAQAVLNTRNKIANVLFKAVMSFQKNNFTADSGYDSLSTDTSSSLSTTQSTSKESLFLPDKLLKEFNNRLTAEMMIHGNNTSFVTKPKHSSAAPNASLIQNTKQSQSLQKNSRIRIGPRVMAKGKERSVSLYTGRRSIKFNPSLPGLKKEIISSTLLNERKSVYIPLSVNTKTVDQQGRLDGTVCTKAVLKISPVQSTTSTTRVPKNVISFNTGPYERFGVRNSPLKLLPNNQEPMSLNLGQEQNSIPITNCLPVTDSEILLHSKNLSDFQKFMRNHGKICGKVQEALQGPCGTKTTISGHDRLGGKPGQRQCPTLEVHADLHKNLKSRIPGQDGTEDAGQRQCRTLKVHADLHKNLKSRIPGQDGTEDAGQRQCRTLKVHADLHKNLKSRIPGQDGTEDAGQRQYRTLKVHADLHKNLKSSLPGQDGTEDAGQRQCRTLKVHADLHKNLKSSLPGQDGTEDAGQRQCRTLKVHADLHKNLKSRIPGQDGTEDAGQRQCRTLKVHADLHKNLKSRIPGQDGTEDAGQRQYRTLKVHADLHKNLKSSLPGQDGTEDAGQRQCRTLKVHADLHKNLKSSLPGQDGTEDAGQRQCRTLKVHADLHKNLKNNLPGQDGTEGFSLPGQDGTEDAGQRQCRTLKVHVDLHKNLKNNLPGQDGTEGFSLPGQDGTEDACQRQCRTLKVHADLHKHLKNNLPGQDGTEGFSLAGQDRGGHPGKSPGLSRKRSFESALFCSSENASPKRTCTRSNNKEKKTSLETGFSKLKLSVGKEQNVCDSKRERKSRRQENLLNVHGLERNTLELLHDKEEQHNNIGGRNIEEQESRESNAWSEDVECKERKRSQKLFKYGTRSSCTLVKIKPCDKVRIPWTTSNNDNTERDNYNSRHKNTVVEGRHQNHHDHLVKMDKVTRQVISPIHGNHATKGLLRQDILEEFKKTPSRNRRTEDKDQSTGSSEKNRRSFTTTCQDNDGYINYGRPVYEYVSEERFSEGFHNHSSRKSFPGAESSRGRNSRSILDHDEISHRKQYPNYQENNSTCSNPHEKVTRRNKLTLRTVEITSCEEFPSSRRKRDREFKEKAQERFDHGVCLNKTFKIDDTHCVSDRLDSCTSNRCRKVICLNCGNFP